MEKVVTGLVVFAGILFCAPLLGVWVGAFSGWVVGFFYTDLLFGVARRFGVDTAGLELWQVGATLGFIGSFFRVANTSKSSSS